MQVIDLFAGVGGLSLGFVNAGHNILLAVESDTDISYSYKKNHPQTIVLSKDITKLNIKSVFGKYEGIDIVIGGPPCQGYSQKGKRMSIDDDRNYLYKYFFDVVNFVKPKYFLLENVPNIITNNGGFFKNDIIRTFNKIDYYVIADVLTASNYGVPQHRNRAFFLGKYRDSNITLPINNGIRTTVKDAIYDLPFIQSSEGNEFYQYEKPAMCEYQIKMRESSSGIFNHISTKHSKIALERMSFIPKGKGRESLPKEHLTKSIYSGTWTRLDENKQAVTITTRFDTPSSGMFIHPILNRCITVREAARLQSFPDNFVFYGNKGSQMKQVGNAVPPLLAYEIAKMIV